MIKNNDGEKTFRGTSLNMIAPVLIVVVGLGLSYLVLFMMDDMVYSSEDQLIANGLGILGLFAAALGARQGLQNKDFFIKVDETGISSHRFDKIPWTNVTSLKFKDKYAQGSGYIDEVVMKYKDKNAKSGKLAFTEKQVSGYDMLKPILIEKIK